MMDERGTVDFMMLVFATITVVVTATVFIVGVDVFNAIAAQSPPPTEVEPGAPILVDAKTLAILATALLIPIVTIGLGNSSSSEPAQPDRVTVLKQQYVDGELDLPEFEERVYDEIEVELE